MSEVFGQQDVATTNSEYNTAVFVFWSLMQTVQTATLVKVVSCTNDGGISPVGTVTVQPLVNQMTGNRQAVPHGQVFNCLYSRLAGGLNAVILDPQSGDIGLMAFCSRDISGVRANEGQANPGSFRMFDWADGIYCGCTPLGVAPTQYVQFSPAGITIVSPIKITLQAPTVEIDASTELHVQTADAEIDSTGAVNIEAGTTATVQATGAVLVEGATATLEASGTATVEGAAVSLAGPVSQTGGGASTFSGSIDAPTVTSQGTVLHTHEHGSGTLVAASTPVTGDTGVPV